jgi:hypothetical protein
MSSKIVAKSSKVAEKRKFRQESKKLFGAQIFSMLKFPEWITFMILGYALMESFIPCGWRTIMPKAKHGVKPRTNDAKILIRPRCWVNRASTATVYGNIFPEFAPFASFYCRPHFLKLQTNAFLNVGQIRELIAQTAKKHKLKKSNFDNVLQLEHAQLGARRIYNAKDVELEIQKLVLSLVL